MLRTRKPSKALAELGPRFVLPFQKKLLSAQEAFGRAGGLILEIGFGMGDATAQIAAVRPDDNFLCCEVHEPGVGALLKRMGEAGIDNIRILQHDAVDVIEHMLDANSLDGVHVFGSTDQTRRVCALRHRLGALCTSHAASVSS